MEICHSQPHLVPPMKLVFYGDLPSPGGLDQSLSSISLPLWVQETRTLASRASQCASVMLTRKKTQSRPKIGAPTDFRRVEPIARHRASFRPLELSIYLPGNRLSDLPEFSQFDVDALGAISPPIKALTSPFDNSGHLRKSSGPFQFSRKPVGSAPSRRSSFGTVDLQLQQSPAQAPEIQRLHQSSTDLNMMSSLIPYFSEVNPLDRYTPGHHSQDTQVPASGAAFADILSASEAEVATMTQDSLTLQRSTSLFTGRRRPGQAQSPLPNTPRNNTLGSSHHSSKSSSSFRTHNRMRTTSSSTVSSRTPSLSSAITAATTIFPLEKEIDPAIPITTLPVIPASVKNSIVVEEPLVLDEHYSLSMEGESGYEFDRRFPLSPVGIAF